MLTKGLVMTIIGTIGIITTIIIFFVVYISINNKIKAFVNGEISTTYSENDSINKSNKYIPNNETEVLIGDSTMYMNEDSTMYIHGDPTVYMNEK